MFVIISRIDNPVTYIHIKKLLSVVDYFILLYKYR